jgi:hypothetical protein
MLIEPESTFNFNFLVFLRSRSRVERPGPPTERSPRRGAGVGRADLRGLTGPIGSLGEVPFRSILEEALSLVFRRGRWAFLGRLRLFFRTEGEGIGVRGRAVDVAERGA